MYSAVGRSVICDADRNHFENVTTQVLVRLCVVVAEMCPWHLLHSVLLLLRCVYLGTTSHTLYIAVAKNVITQVLVRLCVVVAEMCPWHLLHSVLLLLRCVHGTCYILYCCCWDMTTQALVILYSVVVAEMCPPRHLLYSVLLLLRCVFLDTCQTQCCCC